MTWNARRRVRALTAAVGAVAAATASLIAVPAAGAEPGDLDKRFGVKGKVVTSFGAASAPAGNAIDRDGQRLVVAGTVTRGGEERFAVARYRRNGKLDESFAGDGRRVTGFRGRDAVANGVTVDRGGGIVVAGEAGSKIAMVRYRADGRLDRSFSGDGKATTAFPDGSVRAADVALQDDGRMVVAGTFTGEGSAPPSDFAVARYNRSGRLDRSFGTRGRVTTGFGVPGSDLAVGNAVLVQPDGAIVAAGALNNPFSGGGAFALARYDSTGELDASFGGTGKVTTDVGNEGGAIDLSRQPDGSLVAAGESAKPDPPGLRSFFTLIRYGEDGEQDMGFGSNGIVRTRFRGSDDPFATGVAIQPDRRIVAVGQVGLSDGNSSVFGVTRYRRGGNRDRSFGDRGRVTTRFAWNSEDGANGVTLQRRGIVAAGATEAGFALARYRMGHR